MALTGVHVACLFVGGAGASRQVVEISGKAAWSQTMASPGTTTQAAVSNSQTYGDPCFEIRSAADVYVAVGKNPDASQTTGTGDTARILVAGGETRNIFASPGDKLAWILVP